jgi:type II secretory pathway component GspD/PulD (secretin)
VGTIVGLTPDVSDDGAIVLELDVEKSHVHDCPTRGDADQGRVFPPRTVTATCQTTVRVPRGKTVIVGGMQTHSEGESSSLLILVTAELPGK